MSQPPERFPTGFEWDETKNQTNIRKHGIDFRDAVRVFEKPTLDRIDDRQDYGEVRVNSIGVLGERLIANVTYTDREGNTRLISARLATSIERDLYQAFQRELVAEQEHKRDRGMDYDF